MHIQSSNVPLYTADLAAIIAPVSISQLPVHSVNFTRSITVYTCYWHSTYYLVFLKTFPIFIKCISSIG